jgi:lipooligosaccharide transport system permease protein
MKLGYQKVWNRNFFYFRKTWLVTAFWTVLEPLMYLGAFGYGVGSFINNVEGIAYVDFFFPGLLCTTALLVSYFESTYANYTKLTHQKLYASWLLTPLGAKDIIVGEILWGATKGFIGSLGVLLVSSFFGLVKSWMFLPGLIVVFVLAFIFSCVGMIITSYARNYDSFIFSSSGILIPMTLISGTYFPIDSLYIILKIVAYVFPLAHAVDIVRGLMLGQVKILFIIQFLYMLALAWGLLKFAILRLEKKLIS